MRNPKHKTLLIRSAAASWVATVTATARALHYAYSAQRDERNGFPYTAAIEWRQAAEMFLMNNMAIDYCWRQWERIMHLSRQFAGPVIVSQPVAFPGTAFSKAQAASPPAEETSLLLAA